MMGEKRYDTFGNRDPSARWTFFDPKNLQCALPGSDFQLRKGLTTEI